MKYLVWLIFPLTLANPVQAGSLTNGEWTAPKCGEKPAAPAVDGQSVDAYNKSVRAIDEWQQQAKTYYNCIVTEANADNAVIVNKANREQAAYKQDYDAIGAALDAAKKKLDK